MTSGERTGNRQPFALNYTSGTVFVNPLQSQEEKATEYTQWLFIYQARDFSYCLPSTRVSITVGSARVLVSPRF